jgi:hypothetical protein
MSPLMPGNPYQHMNALMQRRPIGPQPNVPRPPQANAPQFNAMPQMPQMPSPVANAVPSVTSNASPTNAMPQMPQMNSGPMMAGQFEENRNLRGPRADMANWLTWGGRF